MPTLQETRLVPASVPRTATFADAARTLAAHEISAIAVLDERERVVGLFTDDDLLRGLFPGYVQELRHTAFVSEQTTALAAQLQRASGDRVERHMRAPITVEVDAGGLHVAERFLHCEWGAIAVVEKERFLGMLDQVEFCRVLMRRVAD